MEKSILSALGVWVSATEAESQAVGCQHWGCFMWSSSPRRSRKHGRDGSGAKSHVTAGSQRMNLRLGM